MASTSTFDDASVADGRNRRRNKFPLAAFVSERRPPLPHPILSRKPAMKASICIAALAAIVTGSALTQTLAQTPPHFLFNNAETTENVYIFRYGGHQSMFVVTPQG